MSLHITPEIIRTAYEYLRSTMPFKRWKLPIADEVEIRVIIHKTLLGQWCKTSHHIIKINNKYIGTTLNLLQTIAHEMIHIAQDIAKKDSKNIEHNKDFYRRLSLVAKYHGFDPKWF